MTRVISEFDPGERPQVELIRNNREDSQDQLRRARHRLERAQRRVNDLEVVDDSWMLLLAQYERSLERNGHGSSALMGQTGALLAAVDRDGAAADHRPAAVRVAPDGTTGSRSATSAATRIA